jgi:hypothetical protein
MEVGCTIIGVKSRRTRIAGKNRLTDLTYSSDILVIK